MSLRDDVLEIISEALPETPENLAFCEGKFIDMLDSVMAKFKEYLDGIFEED